MSKFLLWSSFILAGIVLTRCVDHVIDGNSEPDDEILEPGANFILPKQVSVFSTRGSVFPGIYDIDSLYYEYEYTPSKRPSVIKRWMRTFHVNLNVPTLEREIKDRFEFSYGDSTVEMKVYNEKDNNNLVIRIRFKFSNSLFAFPDYSAVLDGKDMMTSGYGAPYEPYDSLVYFYSEVNFLKEVHLFNDGEFLRNVEFITTTQTINPDFRGFKFSQTPATLNQFCGYYFFDYFVPGAGSYYYPLGNVDPMAFPIKMFKSSEFLVEGGGPEWGEFTYKITNGRLESMNYRSIVFDGVNTDFTFSY